MNAIIKCPRRPFELILTDWKWRTELESFWKEEHSKWVSTFNWEFLDFPFALVTFKGILLIIFFWSFLSQFVLKEEKLKILQSLRIDILFKNENQFMKTYSMMLCFSNICCRIYRPVINSNLKWKYILATFWSSAIWLLL